MSLCHHILEEKNRGGGRLKYGELMSLMRYMYTLLLVCILLITVFLRSALGIKRVYSTQACVMGENTFVIQTYGFSFFTFHTWIKVSIKRKGISL